MDIKGTSFYHLHQFKQRLNLWLSTAVSLCMAWLKGLKIGKDFGCKGVPYFYRSPHTHIVIGDHCRIWSSYSSNNIGSMQRSRICTQTPSAQIIIGNHVGMSAVTIVSHQSITIDDYAMIGAGTLITDSDWHCLSPNVAERHSQNGKSAPVHIGRNAFIGTRCIILKGVSIGENAVIGAGSVVTHDIPANAVAGGNPCHVIQQS